MNATEALLSVRDLAVEFRTIEGTVRAVEHVSFDVAPGQTVALVGESGSGKSTSAMATIGLLPANGSISAGSIRFDGAELVGAKESFMRTIRGAKIGLVPQDPMSNLNPVSKIGTQVGEALLAHGQATKANVRERVAETLAAAGLPDASSRADQYPHEFSGGMRQRALIAIGLACQPKLLIADEPTSALDVTVQKVILDQLGEMTRAHATAVLLITHDLALAAERADRVIVMYRGRVVEEGEATSIMRHPRHEYTKQLVAAAPSVALTRRGRLAAVADDVRTNLLEVQGLTKVYRRRGRGEDFVAANDVTFAVPHGKTVSIVGESGSGKTTTARMVLGIVEPTAGTIRFDGRNVDSFDRDAKRDFRQRVQPIFQDPYSSLNPMFTVERIVGEPLEFYRRGSKTERSARISELLDAVALPETSRRRYPSEMSGGQRQRVAIARALALDPQLLVCDEPVSALDVLVQDQILTLLERLQSERGLSYLFISHDLAVVRQISDWVLVMNDGAVVEQATSEEIFTNPRDPYTRRLLASIPGNELDIAV